MIPGIPLRGNSPRDCPQGLCGISMGKGEGPIRRDAKYPVGIAPYWVKIVPAQVAANFPGASRPKWSMWLVSPGDFNH